MRNKRTFYTYSSPEWSGTTNSDQKRTSASNIHRGNSESVNVPILRAAEVGERWPVLFWFYLKTLGLYHSGFLVRSKLCNRCTKSKKYTATYYMDNQCKVCDSLTWDYNGVPTVIRDHEIGSSFLNHCGSGFLSLVWLLLITGLTLTNIVLLITSYANSGGDIVYVLAWIGMKLLLYVGPFTCLISVVHTTWPSVFMGSWSNALVVEFLVQRMRFVNMKDKRFAGYAFFLASLAVMCTQCLRIAAPYFDPELVSPMVANEMRSSLTTLVPLHFFVIVEGYINFGGFCYLVYLLRCSYESEIKLVTKFLCENINDIDQCRARLAEAFDAFHKFREFSSGWIAQNLILCIVCLFLELHVWIVKTNPLSIFQYLHSLLLLFFLMLPIISLGNIDVDYLWNRLVRQVSRQRKSEQEDCWDKVMQFLQEQRAGVRPWQAVLACFLSTIAVFSAIQFRLWSNNQKSVNVYTMTNGSLSLMQQFHYS